MRTPGVRFATIVIVAMMHAPAAATQVHPNVPLYAGRALVDVLRDLNTRGLRIVFSTALVKPALRVAVEPSGPTLRDVLDQVLRPHGLQAVLRANGVLVVARSPREKTVAEPAQPGTVRGRVIDADTEQPLADVLVVVPRPDRRTVTDRDGRFELSGIAAGSHQMYVSLVGYVLARPAVLIPTDGVIDLVIPLTAGTGAYTEQLTITGHAEERPSPAPSRFRIGSAELQELRGVLADDPLRAVQTMPAAATGDDFRSEFSVRGSTFRQMGFALDGIPASWLVHGVQAVEDTGTIAMINADVLDEVVLTGGASAQTYGNRTGAWLETVMREGSRDANRFTGSLSGTNAALVAEGPLGGDRRGSWLVSARQSYIDWLIRRLDREESTTFGFSDAQSKIVFDVDPRNQIQLTTVLGRSTLHESDESPGPNSTAIGRSGTGLAAASWRVTAGSALVLTQRVAWFGLRYRNTNPFDQDLAEGHLQSWIYRSEAAYAPRTSMTLEGGLFVDRDSASTVDLRYVRVPGAPPSIRSDSGTGRNRWRQGALGRARFAPSPHVELDTGMRVDHEQLYGHTTSSPWIVARWTPLARWTLRAGAGRAFQQPDLLQLPPVGAAPLTAERARDLDLSAEFQWTPAVSYQLSVFDREERDGLRLDAVLPRLVDGVPVAPPASGLWQNGLAVSARGFELLVRRAAVHGLEGWVSYAYGRTRNVDPKTGERYWGDFDQRHLLNVHASYRFSSRTSASARFRYGSNMPIPGYFAEQDGRLVLGTTRNDLRLPTYARLDLRVNRTYDFTRRRLTLFAEVLNVMNRENIGRTDGTVRSDGSVTGFVETLFPILPSAGIRFEF